MSNLFSKAFAPVYEALIWLVLWWGVFLFFSKHIKIFIEAVVFRIKQGSKVVIGPFMMETPPAEIKNAEAEAVAVSDKKPVNELPAGYPLERINAEYEKLIDEGFFLLHTTTVVNQRTTPGSGRYWVKIWVETCYGDRLDEIVQVTYRVWNDFRQNVISTSSSKTNYDLWLSVYGEFPVMAVIQLRDKPPVIVNRYIELPGRPQD